MSTELLFERTIQLFLGTKNALGLASVAYNKKERKKWLLKSIKPIINVVDQLDTSLEHKKILMSTIDQLYDDIKNANEPNWEIVYKLLGLCGRLLGFSSLYQNPVVLRSPIYCQDEGQYFTEYMLREVYPLNRDRADAMLTQIKIAKQLHNEGLKTFKIGLVLNISEYQVKKLLKFEEKLPK